MATAQLNPLSSVREENVKRAISWKMASSHPVLVFLLITFIWSWLVWFATIPLKGRDELLLYVITLIGGYGPALAGILTLGLKSGLTIDLSRKRLVVMACASAFIFTLMALRYLVGNIPTFDPLPESLVLTMPVILAGLVACLLGGWVISSAVSSIHDIRAKMASILPTRLALGWTLVAFGFYAGMLLLSWGICSLLGMEIEYPGLWGKPLLEVAPLFLLSFLLTAFARGGMEEPGWRGTMLPGLQRRFNPLVASLIITVFWSLWHLPLYLNGFYSGDLVEGMIGGTILKIFLAIFLTWFYNRTGGCLFLLIFLHASFNMYVNFVPTNDAVLILLWLVVVVGIVIKDKMYRRLPAA